MKTAYAWTGIIALIFGFLSFINNKNVEGCALIILSNLMWIRVELREILENQFINESISNKETSGF